MNAKQKIKRIQHLWKPLSETTGGLLTVMIVLAFGYFIAPEIAQRLAPIDTQALPYLAIFPPFFLALFLPLLVTVKLLEYWETRIRYWKKQLR